jgi:formylglycine-generating enzyme required for sulfatase activity
MDAADDLKESVMKKTPSVAAAAVAMAWLCVCVSPVDAATLAIEPAMVDIPAGQFQMGDASGKGAPNERPAHRVSVKAFRMGKFEVTYREYDAFADATGRARPPVIPELDVGRADNPVNMVSWQDAVDYSAWLSAQTGKKFRLPSEAEWEYAARAGTTGDYYWGQDAANKYANIGLADGVAGIGGADKWMSYAPVGQFPANPFGLHDVFGNVWEWTQDCNHDNYDGAPADGSAWSTGDCTRHIIRGDSFHNGPAPSTVSARGGVKDRNPTAGFRLAQDN